MEGAGAVVFRLPGLEYAGPGRSVSGGWTHRRFLQPPHIPEADSGALLLDMLDAGVFGASTMERKHSGHMTIQAASAQSRRAGTLWTALFPPARSLQGRFPYLRRWPWLLPAAWCARGFGYLREGRRRRPAATAARIGRQRLEPLEQYGLLDRKA